MAKQEIATGIFSVGAIDWERRLFDELIPLPDGTSYNAYLVLGSEKTALLDTVDPARTRELIGHLAETGVERIDYVVAHHAEQDHSGSLPDILDLYPDCRVVANEKCKAMLCDLLPIDERRFLAVKDGERLPLGGRTLEFMNMPWVHWPETMVTWLPEDKILFPCDLFGSHLAQGDPFAADEHRTLEGAKRYFAEIMMPFRAQIRGHLERLGKLEIGLVAPSHGPVWNRPALILDAYRDWAGDRVANRVLLPHVSMHGSTKRMVDHLVDALIARRIPVQPFSLVGGDVGELAKALVDAATVVLATPTVLGGAHPAAVYAAYLLNALRPKVKHLALIGSYGWGGRTVEQLGAMLTAVKPEILPPLLCKGVPREADFRSLDRLADDIATRHRQAGLQP